MLISRIYFPKPELRTALKLCDDIRATLRGDVYPVIAGGAARDLALDKVPKDYDIFVAAYPDQVLGHAIKLAQVIDGLRVFDGNYYVPGYNARPELLGVLQLPEQKVDIVFIDRGMVDTPQDIVSTFDTSICRAWIEGEPDNIRPEVEVHALPEFVAGNKEKKIWTYSHIKTRAAHLDRIAAKYPDYEMVIEDPAMKLEFRRTLDAGKEEFV